MGMCTRKLPHEAIREQLWAALQIAAQVPVPAREEVAPIEQLLLNVATEHAMTVGELLGGSHDPRYVAARRRFAFQARERGYSYPQIGRMLHKHHSSVIHMVRKQNGAGSLIVKDKVNYVEAVQRL